MIGMNGSEIINNSNANKNEKIESKDSTDRDQNAKINDENHSKSNNLNSKTTDAKENLKNNLKSKEKNTSKYF
jgi:hypothetical protein